MVLVLAMAFFLFIYLMFRTKYAHELKKLDRAAEEYSDRSLTTGELEEMVRGIVAEMTEPLHKRLDQLSGRLGSSSERSLLPSEGDGDVEESGEKTLGRRTRT